MYPGANLYSLLYSVYKAYRGNSPKRVSLFGKCLRWGYTMQEHGTEIATGACIEILMSFRAGIMVRQLDATTEVTDTVRSTNLQ